MEGQLCLSDRRGSRRRRSDRQWRKSMRERNPPHQACRRWIWLRDMGRVPITTALTVCVVYPALAESPVRDTLQFRTELWNFYQQNTDGSEEDQLIVRNY